MKLSLKQKALAQTLGMFAFAIAGGAVLAFIIVNVSTNVLFNAIGVVGFVYLGYVFYSITLSRLESQEQVKELDKKD